jgi:hypothetical protein
VSCQDVQPNLAVYALGALELAEQKAVARHLAECPSCAAEHADLQATAGLLDRLPMRDVLAHAGQAAEPRPPQRRVGHGKALVAAAAAVVLLACGVVVGVARSGGTRSPVAATFAATDAATHVRAEVTVVPASGGSRVTLRLQGAPPDETCWLLVTSRSGAVDDVAAWKVDYRGNVAVSGRSTVALTDLAGLRVVRADRSTLVAIPVS